MPPETVGDRVRRYRRMRKLTQEQLADRADVDRRHVGKIETGDVGEPDNETVKKLAHALDVPLRSLAEPLGWYEEEPIADWLQVTEDAIMRSEASDEAKQAAILVVRSLLGTDAERRTG